MMNKQILVIGDNRYTNLSIIEEIGAVYKLPEQPEQIIDKGVLSSYGPRKHRKWPVPNKKDR